MIFLLNGDIISQPPFIYISNKAKKQIIFWLIFIINNIYIYFRILYFKNNSFN